MKTLGHPYRIPILQLLTVFTFSCADNSPKTASGPSPKNCPEGASRDGSTACGLNAEGFLSQVCTEGVWTDDTARCSGTDICVNNAQETQACANNGTQVRSCAQGQWSDWGTCNIRGCTDPEALNFNADATEDDNSCRYPRSSDTFLDYAKTHYIPGKFPSSACDSIGAHHQCVATQGCNWLRTIKNNGVCREDPVSRCLSSGECVCRAHDFHGEQSHNNDLEVFVPLSITWANLAPRTSAFGGNSDAYSTHIDMAEVINESLENFTSRTDFSLKTLSVRGTSSATTDTLSQSNGLSLAMKFMHVWDQDPVEISGILFDGLGIQVRLNNDQLSVVVDGISHPIQGEHPNGNEVKDYQCNQLVVVIPEQGDAQVYLGNRVTSVSALNMGTVRTHLSSFSSNDDVLRIGPVNAKAWDLKLYGNGRQLTASQISDIGKRCGEAGEYPIPDGYPDSNRRYSWGMGGYDIVLNHTSQSYSSGVYVTMRVPEPDVFPPTDSNYRDNLKRMIGFWDRWQEQMFFEMDLIPFIDRRPLMPADSVNTYRDFTEADNLGENVSGSREPANFNNPCRYVTDLFQGFNWLPEDFPGEPTSADHRKVAERGGWTRWDSHDPDKYGSWQRPVHEHGHTAHFTLMRTYRKVHHYIRGISGEAFAEVMSNYVLSGLKSWMNSGFTYYPSIPLAFEGRWDRNLEKHVFKSSQPYQEKNIDDLGLGARFYGMGAWWFFVSHYAAKPYLVGWISGDNDETPGSTIQKTRFYLAQEGLDFGELFGNYAAHVASWDWPYTGHHFYAQEQEPFDSIEKWCTTNSGPNCTADTLKIQADVDAAMGTGEDWVNAPEGVNPGGFAYNTIRVKNAPANTLYEISLEFDVPSKIYAGEDFHIRLTPRCKNDPRLFSSRIVVSEVGSEALEQRTKRPHYYKIPGRKIDKIIVQTPPEKSSNLYLLAVPTPPFELEDVYPFVQGYSVVWPYKYKIRKLDELPANAQVTAPITLEGDEMLDLTPQTGNGFTYDCFNAE